jgi:hypothetical protein
VAHLVNRVPRSALHIAASAALQMAWEVGGGIGPRPRPPLWAHLQHETLAAFSTGTGVGCCWPHLGKPPATQSPDPQNEHCQLAAEAGMLLLTNCYADRHHVRRLSSCAPALQHSGLVHIVFTSGIAH